MKTFLRAVAAATAALLMCACATPGAGDGLTSLELSRRMSPGWNLGNALEAVDPKHPYTWGSEHFNEHVWGNPKVTQALLDVVAAAGFKTVRIPAAWKQYADADDHISPQWMARVREVVGYARKVGLYVVLNVHWDGGWLQPTYAREAEGRARLAKYWTQIAKAFEDHDHHLLFAGTNEVMVDGDYGAPTAEYCAVQNGFNQLFVDTVRATGGRNATRHLVVQSFNTGIDWALSCNATLPADPAKHRLFMEVHYYDPFHFTINEKSKVWQWGAIATDPAVTDTWGDEAWADAQFAKMKRAFVDRGVPVLLGEYAAMRRTEHDPALTYSTYWNRVITATAVRHGLVPVYWDNGYTFNHEMGLFHRATGAPAYPDVIGAIVDAAKPRGIE
jgi:endoglucanase